MYVYCCQVMAHLLEHGAIVDALDSAGATPLMFAVNSDHGEAAGLLVDYGANVRSSFIRVSDIFCNQATYEYRLCHANRQLHAVGLLQVFSHGAVMCTHIISHRQQ